MYVDKFWIFLWISHPCDAFVLCLEYKEHIKSHAAFYCFQTLNPRKTETYEQLLHNQPIKHVSV